MDKAIEYKIKPDWDEIEKIRVQSENLFSTNHLPENAIHSLVMTISELVENAIKYGIYGDENDMVLISIIIEDSQVTVEVRNPIDETMIPFLKRLDETIQWIRGYQDPFETYIIKLRQISSKPLQDIESGLGLVRISYEGQSILDFYVSDDNVLHVSALYKL